MKKLILVFLITATMSTVTASASKNSKYTHHNKNYDEYILSIDEIDETLIEFTDVKIKWVICDSEISHIKITKSLKTSEWSVTIYAEQKFIEQYKK